MPQHYFKCTVCLVRGQRRLGAQLCTEDEIWHPKRRVLQKVHCDYCYYEFIHQYCHVLNDLGEKPSKETFQIGT